ncbi:hypothetical protein FRC04_003486 [Tulasnella sp. 424]|nr:hypothetical protein FRC04_003486 [Tulasnella sp. 424]
MAIYAYFGVVSSELTGDAAADFVWNLSVGAAGGRSEETDCWTSRRARSTNHLEYLKKLKITDVANDYCAALLTSIYTLSCSRVVVSDVWRTDGTDHLDPFIWQPGNTQTVALLGLNRTSYRKLLGTSVTATGYEVLIRLREVAGYSPRIFKFKGSQPSRMVKLLCEFVHYFPFCPLLDLILPSPLVESDLPDLALYGYHLDSLSLSYSAACLSPLEQLTQRTGAPAVSGTGAGTITEEGWMCPNLLYIKLRIPEDEEPPALHVALLSLVRK